MQSSESSAQSNLFPTVDSITVYEQPLNERIRNCLRLEHLFATAHGGHDGDTEWHTRAAIIGLLEISDLLARMDIKGELIKELERHVSKISGLRNNPSVDPTALEDILADVGPLIVQLKSGDCHPGAVIRNDELITQVRQRIAIPGGTCSFDLPAYHYWLSTPSRERSLKIEEWISDLLIVDKAIAQILKMLRESTAQQQVSVEDGLFQRQIEPAMPCQLIRLHVADKLAVFPEISGGKHRFVIRFSRQPNTTNRPTLARESISFGLQCCGI